MKKPFKKPLLKESEIYIQFFQKYLSLLILPTVAFTLAGSVGYFTQIPNVKDSVLLEMRYTPEDTNQKIIEVEESVILARSEQISDRLDLSGENDISIFKSGPLLVNIEVTGKQQNVVRSEAVKVSDYLKNNFDYMQIGEISEKLQTTPYYIYGIFGAIAGFITGLFISLAKYYLDNF